MDKELRRRIKERCRQGAYLLWQELRDPYGHVSCRNPEGGFFLSLVRVQASGRVYPVLSYDDEGQPLSAVEGGPSEIYLHSEIYRRRPDVMAVAHAHPPVATALSSTDQTLFAVNVQSRSFGTGLPVFAGDFVNNADIGAALAEKLGDGVAIMLEGHGAVTAGAHVPEAVTHMLYVEEVAQKILWAKPFGGARPLAERMLKIPFGRSEGLMGDTFLWRQLMWELNRQGGKGKDPKKAS